MCYATGVAIDRAHRGKDDKAREAAHARASLLTPVAKAFSTDAGIEVASLGIQVHGGMGYIEETGAAQHYRDARIAAIYEGTNGIQALDLVSRKVPSADGATVKAYIDDLRGIVRNVQGANDPVFGLTGARLNDAVDGLDRATHWLLETLQRKPEAALAGASPYLRLFGYAAGGCMLAREALAAKRLSTGNGAGAFNARVTTARFFAENIAVQSSGLERTVTEGADSINAAEAALS